MTSLFTQEEIQERLTNLLNKRDLVRKNRVNLLKKYTSKSTQEVKAEEEDFKLYQLDIEIETLERRLEKMF